MFSRIFKFVSRHGTTLGHNVQMNGRSVRTTTYTVSALRTAVQRLSRTTSPSLVRSLGSALHRAHKGSGRTTKHGATISTQIHTLRVRQRQFIRFGACLTGAGVRTLDHVAGRFLRSVNDSVHVHFSKCAILGDNGMERGVSVSLLHSNVSYNSFNGFSTNRTTHIGLTAVLTVRGLIGDGYSKSGKLSLLILSRVLRTISRTKLTSVFRTLGSLNNAILMISRKGITRNCPRGLMVIGRGNRSELKR